MFRCIAFFILVVSTASSIFPADEKPAQSPTNPYGRIYPPRIYTTQQLKGAPPVIDGRLDDAAWQEGEWAGDYIQQMPTEGAKPSQPTSLKILYDERNIYVAIRAYDDPRLIHRYGTRRDEVLDSGDIVGVCFDSYNDKRTGFEFDLSAGGGKTDLILSNENWDTTWDAVWYGKTAMEENAWTAEFQIPLNQLRYGAQEEQVWGLHAWRWINRNFEEDQWNLIPRNSTGRMYNLGELHGIRGLKRFRHIELLPHTVSKVVSDPEVEGDPYRTGARFTTSVGLDAKVGLTSNFTLDATVNPDFGQVEADPSVMNLTAYETFYPEKRPFFLEGKNIIKFNLSGGSGSEGGDMLFYSRRIGGAPAWAPELREGEYIRSPEMTTILDAVKITGKTENGLSVAVLQSMTSRETARITYVGAESRPAVEPYTNYFLSRVQKDWDKGNTSLGGIVTSTHRWISDPDLGFLPTDALTGGLDFGRYFKNRSYVFATKLVFSDVSGSREAVNALQTNAVHYYQRPDASHLGVDSTATRLSGYGGKALFGTTETGRWRFSETVRWNSPGLELNDIGYLRQADLFSNEVMAGYHESEPTRIFRSFDVDLYRSDGWDFSGLKTDGMTGLGANAVFKNKWQGRLGIHRADKDVSSRLLRGGPAFALDRFVSWNAWGSTDPSRRAALTFGFHQHLYSEGQSSFTQVTPGIALRLSESLLFFAEADFSKNHNDLEYVATTEVEEGARYILGHIRQKTVGTVFRVNYTVTPELSIQYYGSPFVSAGVYSGFKRVAAPLARSYADRFFALTDDQVSYDSETNAYTVKEGQSTYTFERPDFSFRQFRSNLVVRWEPKPGSSLYVVWSQGRTSESAAWEHSVAENYRELWNAPSQNVFLVKLSYWLPW